MGGETAAYEMCSERYATLAVLLAHCATISDTHSPTDQQPAYFRGRAASVYDGFASSRDTHGNASTDA